VAEYLFRDEARLEEAVCAALEDKEHRSDDIEFVVASRGWSQCVEFGSWEMYRERFERTAGESCLLLSQVCNGGRVLRGL